MSGRPEEFHLQSPTDPYVNLSIHTAPASHPLQIFRFQAYTANKSAPPSKWLAGIYCGLTHPLRSSLITKPSTLLQDDPPLCSASVLSFLWGLHLNFSLSIRTTGSHVPYESLNQDHATYMSDAAQTVNRFLLYLSRKSCQPPVLTSS